MMSATDFAFAAELFVLIFTGLCWLFSSSKPRAATVDSTRSIQYFAPLDQEDDTSFQPPVIRERSFSLLPDPWTDNADIPQSSVPVSFIITDAPAAPQLCLPPAKKDVGLDVVLNLAQTELTVKKAYKVLTVFAEKYELAKPKARARKAELIDRIKIYLHDFNYETTMQELVCDAIGGRL